MKERYFYSCKNCEERHVGCHSDCEKYKKEREQHLAEKHNLYVEKKKVKNVSEATIQGIQRMKKSKSQVSGRCKKK
jgi:hypothetical protein